MKQRASERAIQVAIMLRKIFPVLQASGVYLYLFSLVFFVCVVVSSRGLFSSCCVLFLVPQTAEFEGEGWIGMGVFSRNFIATRVAFLYNPLNKEY